PCVRDVAKRPQPLVGEAEVVPLFLFFGQPDPPQRVLRVFGRNSQVVTLVHGFTVSVAPSVRHPGAVAGAQDRLNRGHQSARGNHGLDRPALAMGRLIVQRTISSVSSTMKTTCARARRKVSRQIFELWASM